MIEVAEPGVAVELRWRPVRGNGTTVTGVGPYVAGEPDSVWCTSEWWPLTAAAVAMYDRRVRLGMRALCAP